MPGGIFTHESDPGVGAFAYGRKYVERKISPEALSEMDFLLDTNATRVGNLDFRWTPDDSEPRLEPPHFNQMEDMLETAARIEAGEEVSHHLLILLHRR